MTRRRLVVAAVCAAAGLAIALLLLLPRDVALPTAPASHPTPSAPPTMLSAATMESPPTERVEVSSEGAAAPSPEPAAELAHVRGRCVDEHGQPLAGCAAKLEGYGRNAGAVAMQGDVEWREPEPVTTAADGRFDVAFAPPSGFQFVFDVRADGRASRTGRWDRIAPAQVVDLGDVVLTQGFEVRGRVVDEQSLPVARVLVWVKNLPLPLANTMGASDTRHGYSDDRGEFVVDGTIPPGTWPLDVQGKGLRLLTPDHVTVDPTHGADPVVVTVQQMPKIEGTVVDERGEPVPHVAVRGETHRSGRYPGAWSRDDGTFTIYAVDADPQPIRLLVSDPGPCEPTWNDDRLWPWGSRDVRIELQRALQLELTVVEHGTGAPVTRYAVTCASERSRSSLQGEPRLSGEHPGGRVTVDKVWRGKSTLQVFPLDPALLPSEKIEFEASDAAVPPLRVELVRQTPVSVRVQTPSGAPVSGSTVEVIAKGTMPWEEEYLIQDLGRYGSVYSSDPQFRPHRVVSKAVTDAHGRAELLAPPDGRELGVRVTGNHPPTLVHPVTFVAGHDVQVVVEDSGGITGLVQGSGFELDRLRLMVQPTDADARKPDGERHERLQRDGSFAVQGLTPGSYRAELRLLGFYSTEHGGQGFTVPLVTVADVLVQAGHDTEVLLDATSQQPATMHGRVLLDGAVPEQCRVVLENGRARFGMFVPQSDGRFDAEGLPPGSYRAGLVIGDFRAGEGQTIRQPDTFTLASGEEATRTFPFVRQRLIVVLRHADGTLAADAHALVSATGMFEPRTADATGRLVLDPAPVGEVRLEVGGDALGPITMPAGESEHTFTFTLSDG